MQNWVSLRLVVATVVAVAVLSGAGFVTSAASGSGLSPRWRAMPPPRLAVTATGRSRAMWLWNWTDNAAVISFARANQVTEIFAYVAPGFTNPSTIPPQWSIPEWPLIADLVARARAASVQIDALGGDPSWVQQPAVAAAWATEVKSSGLFAGAHLDLEPWQLAAWTTDQPGTIAQTVVAVATVRAGLAGLPLELSLPWWLYQYTTANGTTLDLALLAYCDSAAIITFFDTAAQIESFGAREQGDAASLSKPARLAVETNNVQPPWLTLAGTSAAAFALVLSHVDAANAATPGYLGVAVEDYTGWRALGLAAKHG